MNNQKEWFIIFVCVLMSAFLIYSALNPNEPAQEIEEPQWDIAVLLRSSSDDYWNYVRKGVDTAALEYHAKIQLHYPEDDGDIEGQVRIAKSILDTNPDALLLAANSDAEFAEILEEANRKKIPVIAIDSLVTSGPIATYIGADNKAYGQAAMKEMAKLIDYEGNIIVVTYTDSGINGKAREMGAHQELTSYDNITIVDRVECSTDIDDCKQMIKSSMRQHSIDGILSFDTARSLSSALALKETNASSMIKMVGFDSTTELIELLQEGHLETLFVQNAFSLGYLGVQYAVDAANGKKLSPTYNMDMTLINKENMFWLKNQKLLFPLVK